MSHPALFTLSLLRGLIEVAMFSLLGQGLLALIAGSRRASNPIYIFFQIVTRPALRAVRWLVPAKLMDKHVEIAAFWLLFCLWLLLAYLKRFICAAQELNCLA